MNKGAIQRFAIWARNELIAQVSQRAYQYGITKEGCGEANAVTVSGRALTGDEQKQRKELVDQIRSKGYTQVMEEVAYTWFNRFIALRFMEVNNYLPSHIRVFSDSTGAFKPEILSDVLHLDLPGLNREKVAEYIESNDTEGLYRYLLLTQCNALNDPLPRMFEKMGGYTELLLPNNILKQDSVLGHMVADIPEEDWTDQVQIIGWLYQYYNSELKDDTFALLKKNVKITKERIPSATQLFTPDWIVRYMVENSLGRRYVDKRKNEGIYADGRGLDEMTWHEAESERIATEKLIADKMGWKYYLPEAEQTQEVRKQLDEIQDEYATLDVKDIKVIDPCMGSGHILVYAFDVLMQIYEASGYSQRDAAQSILENNLYGLDIDDRAAQLAYFAVMMKARQYDRRIFSRGIQPHVYAIVESNGLDSSSVEYFTNNDPQLKKDCGTLMNELRDAKEYGSILNISQVDFSALYARVEEVRADISIFREIVLNSILPLIQVAEVMVQKYDVVVTNPPYMGSAGMDAKLLEFVKKKYPDSKSDLFAVFIERCGMLAKRGGYQSMITQHAWMFLSGYERLRVKMLASDIVNMAHLGPRAFEDIAGEVVQTTSFVFRRTNIPTYAGQYVRLIDFLSERAKEEAFLSGSCRLFSAKSKYALLPGSPMAYWVSKNVLSVYNHGVPLGEIAAPRKGNSTSDNNRFLRFWAEIDVNKMNLHSSEITVADSIKRRWYPYNKGGGYRKWYGFNEYLVDWYNDAAAIRSIKTAVIANYQYFMKPGLTWSTVSSNNFSIRQFGSGYIFDNGGCCIFDLGDKSDYLLGLLNSEVFRYIFGQLNPTLNFQSGEVAKFPVIYKGSGEINALVKENVHLSTDEYDSYETSWDFERNPLVNGNRLIVAYAAWKQECEDRFQQLKKNEEELNRIFIDIYGLQDELTPDVADKDVTVHRVFDSKDDVPESMKGSNYVRTMRDEIVSLISYAVGCMFGRYSLDVDGLAYAGGEWDESRYKAIVPDSDNIIPICDDDYFDDDITGRFVKWVETVYGKETLEENLKFIADALGGKGTPREVIRSYFLNDFYADHLKTLSEAPDLLAL